MITASYVFRRPVLTELAVSLGKNDFVTIRPADRTGCFTP